MFLAIYSIFLRFWFLTIRYLDISVVWRPFCCALFGGGGSGSMQFLNLDVDAGIVDFVTTCLLYLYICPMEKLWLEPTDTELDLRRM
jgi:hypothetical protein